MKYLKDADILKDRIIFKDTYKSITFSGFGLNADSLTLSWPDIEEIAEMCRWNISSDAQRKELTALRSVAEAAEYFIEADDFTEGEDRAIENIFDALKALREMKK